MELVYQTELWFVTVFYSLAIVLGGLFPFGSGKDLRVSTYLIADNAAMIENMDTSHICDVTDIIIKTTPAK